MILIKVVFRTLFFYFFITISYRLMGKREIGQLGVIDLIVSILIAELVAISIENNDSSMLLTILPISLLVFLEILLAYISMKNRKIRVLLEGKPSIIISRGKINYHEMIKQRYSLDDLLLSLRQKEIRDITEVEFAFLEPNGKLSIFKYKPLNFKNAYPMPIIVDGKVDYESLKTIKKTSSWIDKVLVNKNIDIDEIFYAFYKNKKLYIIKKD